MVHGPRLQLSPTTSAPAPAKRLQASSGVRPSRVTGARWKVSVMTAGSPVARMTSRATSDVVVVCGGEQVGVQAASRS